MEPSASGRRIEFIETLGRGGFGAVYLADVWGEDDFVQRLAVKVLNERMSSVPDLAARQRDEARLLAQLNHDHIVKVMDLTQVHGRPAVIMEYVEGIDAGHILNRSAFPPRAALQVAAAAASALDAAYNTVSPRTNEPLCVVHRDIKPNNLLVSAQGGIKVLDFGVARADFDREGQTQSAQFGTPRFMAPEQWLQGQIGPALDVFALGLTLAELLAGTDLERLPLDRRRFEAKLEETIAAAIQPDWPSPWVRQLQHTLRRMMAFSPDDRPTAAELYEALTDLADGAPGEGLKRFARRTVPGLVEERRSFWKKEPLLPHVTPQADTNDTAVPFPMNPPTETAPVPKPDPSLAPEPDASVPPPLPSASTVLTPTRAIAASVVFGFVLVVAGLSGAGLWLFAGDGTTSEPTEESVDAAATPRPAPVAATQPEAPVEAPMDDIEAQEQAPDTEPAAIEASPWPAPAASSEPVHETAPEPPASKSKSISEPITPRIEPDEPRPPEVEPSALQATRDITVSSKPLGATLFVDGARVGSTPRTVELSHGTHRVVLHMPDGKVIKRTLEVTRHGATNHVWESDRGTWAASL